MKERRTHQAAYLALFPLHRIPNTQFFAKMFL